jgi:mRNA interferase MazF
MGMVVNRFEVYWVNLDPTVGNEIRKTRPCVVISNNEANRGLRTVIIAPITSTIKNYPTWIRTSLLKRKACINLDQIRSVDKSRLIKKIGIVNDETKFLILETLQEMFEE